MQSSNQRAIIRLLLATAVLLAALLLYIHHQRDDSIAVALAKSSQLMAMGSDLPRTLSLAELPPDLSDAQFVQAARLAESEAAPWGCPAYTCALATFYDLERGVTVNRVIDLPTNTVLAAWEEPHARPAGSIHILPLALQIAAADAQVQTTLGDIGAAEPAMIPMSGWLADDDCRRDWCVDLTFHAPQGDGRIYHIFVNLEQGRVARTFYTRGRPTLNVPPPISQRDAFSDGCHKQNGWYVCWQMTADDGLDFSKATFDGRPVFHSAKVGQVEVWYPSWPGGYRDEIGFNGTVRPYGDTQLIELENGFEVRQLFTEFTRWPNCICCYRYEQVGRFLADGAYEFEFVSHGPGCDDLSVYRPFWRIALADTSELWRWQRPEWLSTGIDPELEQAGGQGEWVPATAEQEIHPFVQPVSPDGYQITLRSQDRFYKWRMVPTDPLAQDEARLFLLRANPNEGDGPILTGPGDSYEPPRQWLNAESLFETDVVVWFVPLLKTKMGNPWWCMPDPRPGINQCHAVLRVSPATTLYETAVTAPFATTTPTATPTPLPAATPAPTPTPRPIDGETAEEIILNAGCGACHRIGALGEAGKVGPDLSEIGRAAGMRVPGLAAADYLYQSLSEPNAFLSPHCPNGACLPNIMPPDYDRRLTPAQMETLVAFLLAQGQPPPVTATFQVIGQQTATAPSAGNDRGTAVPPATPPPQQSPPSTQPGWGSPYAVLLLLLVVVVVVLFFIRRLP